MRITCQNSSRDLYRDKKDLVCTRGPKSRISGVEKEEEKEMKDRREEEGEEEESEGGGWRGQTRRNR